MKRSRFSASIVSLLLAGPASAAPVLIDSFITPAVPVVFVGPAPAPVALHSGAGIFGTRTLVSSTALALGDVVAIGGGTFQVFTGTTPLETTLSYVFPATQNFSSDIGVQFQFLFLDAGVTTGPTEFDVTLATSSGTLTGSFTLPDSGVPVTTVLPFSSFTGPGNLGAVFGATFAFNDGIPTLQGTDFILDNLAVTGPAFVPEPSSIALAVCGLLGVAGTWGRARLRRKQA